MKRKISLGDIVQHKKFPEMRGYVYQVPSLNGNSDPMGCYWVAIDVCHECGTILKSVSWLRKNFIKIEDYKINDPQ